MTYKQWIDPRGLNAPDAGAPVTPEDGPEIIYREIARYNAGTVEMTNDRLAVEDPLEVVVNGQPFSVIMRLPGDDLHLALGHCYTAGLITSRRQVRSVQSSHGPGQVPRIILEIEEGIPSLGKQAWQGLGLSLSSSGLAGARSLLEIDRRLAPVPRNLSMDPGELARMAKMAEERQAAFSRTGGTHFAALFSSGREMLAFAEDVGRHNALDKAVGRLLREEEAPRAACTVLSSRLSFEMVQKAASIGTEVLAGLSAATSCAVNLAEELDMTLVGFLRGGRMNIYTQPERLLAREARKDSRSSRCS